MEEVQLTECSVTSSHHEESSSRIKVSFGVKRTNEIKILDVSSTIMNADVDSDEERAHEEAKNRAKRRKIKDLHETDTLSDDERKKPLIIPVVKEKDWRIIKLLEQEKDGTLTDEDRAKLAILTESQVTEKSSCDDAIIVDESSKVIEDPDYSVVPLEEYGLAILRGCGWKEGDGIGRCPQVIPLRLPTRRPNGLGLGATIHPESTRTEKDKKSGKYDKLNGDISKNSFVRIIDGRHKGMYGLVESRDDDNNSLFIRLAVGGQIVKVSLFTVRQVSRKEYDRDSRCINKEEYNQEKAKIEERNTNIVHNEEGKISKNERSNGKMNGKGDNGYVRGKEEELWARTDLIVRFIDEKYKKGKHYKEKMRIVDVASPKDISLKDTQGRMHYGIRQSWLETVIPRNDFDRVMVVKGKYKGRPAAIERRDKSRSKIVVQLIPSKEILKLDFDDICQHHAEEDDDPY